MSHIKYSAARVLERLGIGLGHDPNSRYKIELVGFRPYPIIKIPNDLDHEWSVGFQWYLKRIEGGVILDAGYMAHKGFTRMLRSLGFRVIGIDLKAEPLDDILFNPTPIWNTPVPRESVDTIIANSLFEHLGLDCYKQPEMKDARVATLEEFAALLKPNGILLMQVPYSREAVLIKHKGEDFYIPWTHNELEMLGRYLTIEETAYYGRAIGKWVEISEVVANRIKQGGGFPSCIVFIKARKLKEVM